MVASKIPVKLHMLWHKNTPELPGEVSSVSCRASLSQALCLPWDGTEHQPVTGEVYLGSCFHTVAGMAGGLGRGKLLSQLSQEAERERKNSEGGSLRGRACSDLLFCPGSICSETSQLQHPQHLITFQKLHLCGDEALGGHLSINYRTPSQKGFCQLIWKERCPRTEHSMLVIK